MSISNGAPSKSIGNNEYLESVRNKMRGLRISIISSKHAFVSGKNSSESRNAGVSNISEVNAASGLSLEKSLSKTLVDWFELQIVEPSIITADADIYLLLEEESDALGTQGDRLPWTTEIMQLIMENKLIFLSTALASVSERSLGQLKSVQSVRQP